MLVKKKKELKLILKLVRTRTSSSFLHVVTSLSKVQTYHDCTLLPLYIAFKTEGRFTEVCKVPVGMVQSVSNTLLLFHLGRNKTSLHKHIFIFIFCIPQVDHAYFTMLGYPISSFYQLNPRARTMIQKKVWPAVFPS